MTGGWIKLYRQLLDKPIWLESSPEQKVILITLLSMANHEEKEWEWQGVPYKAKPGQFVTSLPSIAKKAGKGISLQNVRTALKRFEKYNFLTDESTKQNRLITIVNWGVYQAADKETNSQTNSQLTDDQQTPNSQLTANKNVKNDKNVRSNNNMSKKPKKRVYSDDDPNKILAKFLYKKISENMNVDEPDFDKWANTIRLTIESDKRSGKEVQDMIIWATQDDFWSSVIQSPTSLRKNFHKMLPQKNKKNKNIPPAVEYKESGDNF